MKNKKYFFKIQEICRIQHCLDTVQWKPHVAQKGQSLRMNRHGLFTAFVSLPMRKRIQKARTEAGLSQKELAQKLNVRHQIVQTYENGTAIPTGRLIQSIEQACGVPYGTISGKTRKMKTQKKMKKKSVLKLIKT